VLPNELLPNTFLAQAYDLHDGWDESRCSPCCSPGGSSAAVCASQTASLGGSAICRPACAALAGTPASLAWIHPRLKRPIGERLAMAAEALVYGRRAEGAAVSGPTLASCHRADGGASIRFDFDKEVLGSEHVVVRPTATSLLEVLTGPRDAFCLQPMQRCKADANRSWAWSAKTASLCQPGEREWFCPAGVPSTSIRPVLALNEDGHRGVMAVVRPRLRSRPVSAAAYRPHRCRAPQSKEHIVGVLATR